MSTDDDRPDISVDGAKGIEDIVIEKRLDTIFDIRRNIHAIRRRLRMGQHDDSISTFEMLSGYRIMVTNYLMEIHPLLLKFEEKGHDLLERHDFGEAEVGPTTRRYGRDNSRYLIRPVRGHMTIPESATLPEVTHSVPLDGLYSLMDASDPLEGVVAIPETDPTSMRTKQVRVRYSDQISMSTLDEMNEQMNVFLSEIGLELEPDSQDADRVAEYDYSDLI